MSTARVVKELRKVGELVSSTQQPTEIAPGVRSLRFLIAQQNQTPIYVPANRCWKILSVTMIHQTGTGTSIQIYPINHTDIPEIIFNWSKAAAEASSYETFAGLPEIIIDENFWIVMAGAQGLPGDTAFMIIYYEDLPRIATLTKTTI